MWTRRRFEEPGHLRVAVSIGRSGGASSRAGEGSGTDSAVLLRMVAGMLPDTTRGLGRCGEFPLRRSRRLGRIRTVGEWRSGIQLAQRRAEVLDVTLTLGRELLHEAQTTARLVEVASRLVELQAETGDGIGGFRRHRDRRRAPLTSGGVRR